ncbi:MAG: phosphopyruvate hydratase [Chloroflexota bacterium]
MTSKISKIYSRQVLDSRGNPTIFTSVETSDGKHGVSYVPSGASTGSREALELRDGDKNRFGGKSVYKAVRNIMEVIAPALIGKESTEQSEIDQIMIDLDGTPTKSSLGANAILGVSMANARVAADSRNQWLFEYIESMKDLTAPSDHLVMPRPMFNILNGGSHAFNSTDFQEFMIVPKIGMDEDFEETLLCGFEIYNQLKKILEYKNLPSTVGDEGGFALSGFTNSDALDLLLQATEKTKFKVGEHLDFALDVAASEFYNAEKKSYKLNSESREIYSDELISIYEKLLSKYPIYSIEDGLAEDDWDGWEEMTNRIGKKVQLVGDDLFVTQQKFLERGIKENVGNSILIKLNQVGTVSETIDTIKCAQENEFSTIISHRSGETEDTFIADLCIGTKSDQIKSGAPARGERVNKYNRLLLIEDHIKGR